MCCCGRASLTQRDGACQDRALVGDERWFWLAAAREAVRYLTRDGGPRDGFWIHLDADVLDETIMQAVDDPRPDGLAWDEVRSALSVAVCSGHAVGLQVAIYNPEFDAGGSNGRGLAATVREALAASADM